MEPIQVRQHRRLEPFRGSCVLLANPFARGVEQRVVAHMVRLLGLEGRAVREVGRDGTARSLAEEAVRNDVPVVFAAGGDGTIHQVVQVLAGTGSALGVVPLGTSNDLAKHIGIPHGVAGLSAVLDRARITELDLIKFGRVRIVTVGGFGLPAHVADFCNRLKSRSVLTSAVRSLGGGIYPVVAGSRIVRRGVETSAYTIHLNRGPATTVRASAVIVGLVAQFGGGLRLVRNGEARPGTFAVLFVTATTRCGMLRTLWRMKIGRQIEGLATSHTGLTRLTVRTRGLVGSFGDGEWLGLMHRTEIKLEPQSLRVLLPGHQHSTHTVLRALREAL